jgi:hypothetical protein
VLGRAHGPDPVLLRRLGVAALVLLLTSPAAVLADDVAGDVLGLRQQLSRPAPSQPFGPFLSQGDLPTRPGETMYLTASRRSSTSCEVLDGDTWTPLPRVYESPARMWPFGRRSGLADRSREVRIHDLLAVEPVTSLRCRSSRRTAVRLWRDDPAALLAYRTAVHGVRGAWPAVGTAPLWLPVLRRYRRQRREPA